VVIGFHAKGSISGPMSNAERQQRWRDKHRARKAKAVTAPPPGAAMVQQAPAAPAPLDLDVAPPQPISKAPAAPAPEALVLPPLPVALAVKVLFETHVRAMPPKQRWQLARMITDDLVRTL
jgi:hypothetical protein